jgi:hypothetical protein
MTRFEKFQGMTIKEFAAELCSLQWCSECPVYEKCEQDNDDTNGFEEWLKEEVEE